MKRLLTLTVIASAFAFASVAPALAQGTDAATTDAAKPAKKTHKHAAKKTHKHKTAAQSNNTPTDAATAAPAAK